MALFKTFKMTKQRRSGVQGASLSLSLNPLVRERDGVLGVSAICPGYIPSILLGFFKRMILS